MQIGSKKELDAHINKRLELYQDWEKGDDRAYTVNQVEHYLRYGKKCEGLLEVLCCNFLDDIQTEDLFEILRFWDKDLKKAYKIMMDGIEAHSKGRRVYIPE